MNKIPFLKLLIISIVLSILIWTLFIGVISIMQDGCRTLHADTPTACDLSHFTQSLLIIGVFSLGLAYVVPVAIFFLIGWIYYKRKNRIDS